MRVNFRSSFRYGRLWGFTFFIFAVLVLKTEQIVLFSDDCMILFDQYNGSIGKQRYVRIRKLTETKDPLHTLLIAFCSHFMAFYVQFSAIFALSLAIAGNLLHNINIRYRP